MTTRELLAAQRRGAQILHNGAPVLYRPRWANDKAPWLYTDGETVMVRYSATQCDAHEGETK